MEPRRLGTSDFAVPPIDLAIGLLGAVLVRRLPDGTRLAARIVETEAYCGAEDKAAHTVGWRRTPRTEPMFGPPGTSYVFLTYGMHHCFNAVCGAAGEPVAVLVRAAEPVDGVDRMRSHRARTATGKVRKHPLRGRDLCSGPARLCQAMAIDHGLNAVDLTQDDAIWIEPRVAKPAPGEIVNTTRIGVEYAGAWADAELRWYLRESEHVSVR
ncbi:MAG: DNA-3-methyladenine glycosylase [Planctomycetota bacterium]